MTDEQNRRKRTDAEIEEQIRREVAEAEQRAAQSRPTSRHDDIEHLPPQRAERTL